MLLVRWWLFATACQLPPQIITHARGGSRNSQHAGCRSLMASTCPRCTCPLQATEAENKEDREIVCEEVFCDITGKLDAPAKGEAGAACSSTHCGCSTDYCCACGGCDGGGG